MAIIETTVEPLWKGQESLTKVAKFGPFPRTILYKSYLFYPSWQATSFERPLSWVAFIEGFHCIILLSSIFKPCHCHLFEEWVQQLDYILNYMYLIFKWVAVARQGCNDTKIVVPTMPTRCHSPIHTLKLRQNGRNFTDIFKLSLLHEICFILINILLKFVLKGQINNNPELI